MKKRCYNKKFKFYYNYGGRGIKVCDRWNESFENFLADMGPCPKDMTLERKENDGNYCPENCKWASRKEQCRNMRTNRMITFRGETLCSAEWAERLDIKRATIEARLDVYGYSVERALTEPLQKDRKKISNASASKADCGQQ